MAKGNQKGALLKRWELSLWAYQGLKQQWGDRKEASGTCLDQHGFSSETEGSCTRVCIECLLSVPNNPRLKCNSKKQILNHLSLSARFHFKYLMCSCYHAWRSALQVLLASLLFDLVEGGAWLIGCCNGLLRPVIDQFVKIISECASLVVAVVGLDLSEPCDWLRRWWGCGRGERRLCLTGICLSCGGVERRPWKATKVLKMWPVYKGQSNQLAAGWCHLRHFLHNEPIYHKH